MSSISKINSQHTELPFRSKLTEKKSLEKENAIYFFVSTSKPKYACNMGCIKKCFSGNMPLLLLQKHTVDRAIYHLNQSRSNQYLVCDTADDNLYKK